VFGIVRPCRHRLPAPLHAAWLSHLCGLCLTLRDEHGQAARLVTNYDGLLVSVLVSAQRPEAGPTRPAGPCALRGLRRATVVDSAATGARLAAAVSLVLAAAKARDHLADRDLPRAAAPLARRLADRWATAGGGTGAGVGFDVTVLTRAVARQRAVERDAGPGDLPAVTAPTGDAVAAAFAHTAVLAGRPGNAPPLAEAGRMFGRIAHLLDAVQDLPADTRRGRWNPLTATGTSLAAARALADGAVAGLRRALRQAEMPDPRLAHLLLAHEVGRAVEHTFGHPAPRLGPPGWQPPGAPPPGSPPPPGRPTGPPGYLPPPAAAPPRRRLPLPLACAAWVGMCCTCQLCCCEHTDPLTGRQSPPWCQENRGCCDACSLCPCDCSACDCSACDCCDCNC